MTARRLATWTAVSLSLLWTYLWVVLVFEGRAAGVVFRTRYSVPLLLVVWGLTFVALAWLRARRMMSSTRQKELMAAGFSVLLSLIALDLLYGAYTAANRPTDDDPLAYARNGDANAWHGEVFPRSYFPTDANFTLYKPNVRVRAWTYGEFYDSRMLDSPTLVDSVLQLRPLTYSIDENGFRNRFPIEEAEIFALGDSFAMGFSTDEGRTWIDHLGGQLGRPVYNLGVSASGPGVQLQLLEHLVRSKPDTVGVKHLLWMIFEGNDLENPYGELRPGAAPPAAGSARIRNLVWAPFVGSARGIKERSVMGKLVRGELQWRGRTLAGGGDPYLVDGVPLVYPLYHSDRWGPRLFNPVDIDRATEDASYVQTHPNRPALDTTFERMRTLSEEFGFRVTVLIAPTAVRVHAADFEDLPAISPRPHFIEYVVDLSRRTGFAVVDLLPLMAPYAETGLLYYRDDHHWNERGNEVAAQVVGAQVDF